MTTKTRHIIESATEIELLSSPVRQEIIDTLEALGGEAAVVDIAAQLGRPADGLYYHLRLLARGGLVEEIPDEGAGRRFRTRARGGERLHLRYRPGKTRNACAVSRVAAGMLRTANHDFSEALRDPGAVADGPTRAVWAGRTKGWVGDAELAEMNRLLDRMKTLLRRARGPRRARLVSFTWVLAPVPAMPTRRGAVTNVAAS
jgi:DNA-binding transcriptional ArsR family regulator